MYAWRVALTSAISALLLLAAPLAEAATLNLGSASVSVGGTVSIPLTVSSSESLNAISANLSFPTDKLSLISVSKSPSVITLWAQEPVYSNANGTVSLEGIVPNPGYSGSGGRVATLVFAAKAEGTASVTFGTASVLANDGQGTNILTNASSGSISIAGAVPAQAPAAPTTPEAQTEPAPSGSIAPSAFPITSSTHPDQTAWYREAKGSFTWPVPQGATATRLLISPSPSATPTVLYDTPIGSKTIDDIPEGTQYLLVQHQVAGAWGGIGRYRINVDATGPRAFRITFPHGAEGFNPQPIILFNTLDDESGIDHYDVKVGKGDLLRTAAAADSNPYTLPMLEPGEHVVLVSAYDRAGNVTEAEATVTIEGIEAPRITHYEETVVTTDLVNFRGITYANADVTVYVYDEDGEPVAEEFTRSNSLGDFATALSKRLSPGSYTATARVVDSRGARSPLSEPVSFEVEGRFFSALEDLLYDYLAPLIVFLAAVAGAGCIIFLAAERMYKRFNLSPIRRNAAAGPERMTRKAFDLLRRDILAHAKKLKSAQGKRVLTDEEASFLETFAAELDDAETAIEKEMTKKRRRAIRVKEEEA